jgi:hypothetical protein
MDLAKLSQINLNACPYAMPGGKITPKNAVVNPILAVTNPMHGVLNPKNEVA